MKDQIHINTWYRKKEASVVKFLLENLDLPDTFFEKVEQQALAAIQKIRENPEKGSYVAKLMQQFKLSSPQGLTLMAMAESLLRIPDKKTADKLIQEKLAVGDWAEALEGADSQMVKLSKHALVTSQKILSTETDSKLGGFFKNIVAKAGAPVIRTSVKTMMGRLAQEFILGDSIENALKRAKTLESRGYRYSYDMLGEAAMTAADAQRYFQSYQEAILSLANASKSSDIHQSPSISVKLSALHPRYKYAQKRRVLEELVPRVVELCLLCKQHDIALTIDAEETDVLELSLDIFNEIARSSSLDGWNGLGIVIQAYQKRAPLVVDWVLSLAKETGRRINVRLVKGAYWDTEIKRAQVESFNEYPVFTYKFYTDLCYLYCARLLLENREFLYPQFATHNAYTAIAILNMAGDHLGYELQKLHGMGDHLYETLLEKQDRPMPACRIYAPVGSFNDLLPYLVRRLLENGANTSFVHHLTDLSIPPKDLVKNPVALARAKAGESNSQFPLPHNLFGQTRQNSKGLDLSDDFELQLFYEEMAKDATWDGHPIIDGKDVKTGLNHEILNPADHTQIIGQSWEANEHNVTQAYDIAQAAFDSWSETPAEKRAAILNKIADLYEENKPQLMSLCVREAGKTIPDALAEVREAVDFCRYYAVMAVKDFSSPQVLHGPTGELDQISLHGRGTFTCISPWNFPLAIFTGQVTAALVAGNCVVAKPAASTTAIATYAVKLMLQAGVPSNVLHLVPGSSSTIGESLLGDPRVAGVCLTGSVETAHQINRSLARSNGPIRPLIAETGGQNAMFVDSSALTEQVIRDVLSSAFQSAGQRCSALRILLLQEDNAEHVIAMLKGAMKELKIGNPAHLSTDVGPVISKQAKQGLESHIKMLTEKATEICRVELPADCTNGTFVTPVAFELKDFSLLKEEHFGPILHVIRYKSNALDDMIAQLNGLGFGLTLGIHSRIENTYRHIFQKMRVGNTYVNRNIIGAVVGVQPFGGEGLSGTGPKAGGPRYLHRFATEKVLSIDTTAQGGNTSLMSLSIEG